MWANGETGTFCTAGPAEKGKTITGSIKGKGAAGG